MRLPDGPSHQKTPGRGSGVPPRVGFMPIARKSTPTIGSKSANIHEMPFTSHCMAASMERP